jgi:hypothetical protein
MSDPPHPGDQFVELLVGVGFGAELGPEQVDYGRLVDISRGDDQQTGCEFVGAGGSPSLPGIDERGRLSVWPEQVECCAVRCGNGVEGKGRDYTEVAAASAAQCPPLRVAVGSPQRLANEIVSETSAGVLHSTVAVRRGSGRWPACGPLRSQATRRRLRRLRSSVAALANQEPQVSWHFPPRFSAPPGTVPVQQPE